MLIRAERKNLAKQRLFSHQTDQCPCCKKGKMILVYTFTANKDPPVNLPCFARITWYLFGSLGYPGIFMSETKNHYILSIISCFKTRFLLKITSGKQLLYLALFPKILRVYSCLESKTHKGFFFHFRLRFVWRQVQQSPNSRLHQTIQPLEYV